jgi:hypothetical protein
MKTKFDRKRTFGMVGLVLVLLASSAILAGAQGVPVVYHACVNNSSGTIHMIPADGKCNNNEQLVTWNSQGPPGQQGLPGAQGDPGPAGLACWDLNGDGIQDAAEDVNQDGLWNAADCKGPQGETGSQGVQGLQGTPGEPGAPGAQGDAGPDGLACWDLNGDGVQDTTEDINSDGVWNALDCQGPQGEQGPPGSADAWSLTGSSGTTADTNYLGTSDNQALEIKVNGARALRLEPNAEGPNVIGGYSNNGVAAGVHGATIAGGGGHSLLYRNTVVGNYGTVGGGWSNLAGTAEAATVGGGYHNAATGYEATVAGGGSNAASGIHSSVGGGLSNTARGNGSTVGGGMQNTADANGSTVGGGQYNTAFSNSATVGGGVRNTAYGAYATVPGGAWAAADHYGQMAHASGMFAAAGDAQASQYVLRRVGNMSAGAWYELFLNESDIRLTIASGRTMTFEILITARTSAGESAGYRITGVIENSGGTTALIGIPPLVTTVLGEDDTAWDAQVIADDTNDALVIQVQGNGETIRWVATVDTAEVAW